MTLANTRSYWCGVDHVAAAHTNFLSCACFMAAVNTSRICAIAVSIHRASSCGEFAILNCVLILFPTRATHTLLFGPNTHGSLITHSHTRCLHTNVTLPKTVSALLSYQKSQAAYRRGSPSMKVSRVWDNTGIKVSASLTQLLNDLVCSKVALQKMQRVSHLSFT